MIGIYEYLTTQDLPWDWDDDSVGQIMITLRVVNYVLCKLNKN